VVSEEASLPTREGVNNNTSVLVRGLFGVGGVAGLLAWFDRLIVARLGLLFLSGDRRDAEILALRHQSMVLQRQIKRTWAFARRS